MNVLISVDMEGISGVVAEEHTSSNHKEYERFRKLMTAEANAAVEGALAGGASRVVVNDSHGGMANILIEELNPAAELISGSPKPFAMMQGIGPDVDVAFFVGYHGASGAGAAILSHTWTYRIVEARLNGQMVGETGLNAALAGAYGVPVVLVAGDTAVTEEARALLGKIETVAVKEGVTRTAARCLHPEVAREKIRQAAERALKLGVAPFRPLSCRRPSPCKLLFNGPGTPTWPRWFLAASAWTAVPSNGPARTCPRSTRHSGR
jgi:D-amino peptidase